MIHPLDGPPTFTFSTSSYISSKDITLHNAIHYNRITSYMSRTDSIGKNNIPAFKYFRCPKIYNYEEVYCQTKASQPAPCPPQERELTIHNQWFLSFTGLFLATSTQDPVRLDKFPKPPQITNNNNNNSNPPVSPSLHPSIEIAFTLLFSCTKNMIDIENTVIQLVNIHSIFFCFCFNSRP